MTFAGCRRCKRLLLHAPAFNLGLLMLTRFGYVDMQCEGSTAKRYRHLLRSHIVPALP